MDDIYVILSILVISILIFIVLFSPSPYSKHSKIPQKISNKEQKEQRIERIQHPPINTELKDPTKFICYDPRMQSMNSRQKGHIGIKQDEETLASFYVPAKDIMPEDYPLKLVGECPYSKPLSNDLPIPNIPLCIATKNDYNMKCENGPTTGERVWLQ